MLRTAVLGREKHAATTERFEDMPLPPSACEAWHPRESKLLVNQELSPN